MPWQLKTKKLEYRRVCYFYGRTALAQVQYPQTVRYAPYLSVSGQKTMFEILMNSHCISNMILVLN